MQKPISQNHKKIDFGSYLYKDLEAKCDYIADVFDILIVHDIRQKYKIRNPILMNRIVDFLMDPASNLTSARNIADSLTTKDLNPLTLRIFTCGIPRSML